MSCEAPEWNEKYTFQAEWYDPLSSVTRPFLLAWYPWDSTIELFDLKFKRVFLKRTKIKGLSLDDLYVGNSVVILSRYIHIYDYANLYTRRMMGISMQKVFAIIKPESMNDMSKILKILLEHGFKIDKMKKMIFQTDQIEGMFSQYNKGDSAFKTIESNLTSGPVLALGMLGPNGLAVIKELAGPESPEEARKEAPTSIRAIYGYNEDKNGFYIAPDNESVTRCTEFAFEVRPKEILEMSTAVLKDCTCCVIKPHAVKDGHVADIIIAIENEGYRITAIEMFNMNHINASEFLEVYNGIVPEYQAMVSELSSGSCVAMEIVHPSFKEETPVEFRKLVGPSDPDVARQLRPDTLRAKFGVDKVKNGLHVTDLPEDAILEVEYFFRILQM